MDNKPDFTNWTSDEYDNWQNGQLKPMPPMTDQQRWEADYNALYHDHGFSVREAYFALGPSPAMKREFEAVQVADVENDYKTSLCADAEWMEQLAAEQEAEQNVYRQGG